EDRSQRFILNITTGGIRLCWLVLKEPLCVVGIKSTCARTFLHLLQGCPKQFSHFEGNDFGESLLFQQQQLGSGLQEVRTLAKRSSTIFRGGVFGSLQSIFDFGIIEGRKLLHLFACNR